MKSSFYYRRAITGIHEFDYGYARSLGDTALVHALVGVELSGFNSLEYTELPDFKFRPVFTLGLKYLLTSDIQFYSAYDHRFDSDYLTTELRFRLNNVIVKPGVLIGKDGPYLTASTQILF